MDDRIVKLPQAADRNIDQVLEAFLAEQRQRLRPSTFSKYEEVVNLLRHHMNADAYQGLDKAEAALFDTYFHAEGESHKDFCQLFGPEKIIENLGGFLGYFIIRKVMAGKELKRSAGTVTKRLSKWLAASGYVPKDAASRGAQEGADAARDLPRAEQAAQLLWRAADRLGVDPTGLSDEDYLDFDQYAISRIEPGKLWLSVHEAGSTRELGPIPAPKSATELLTTGWEISCALGRIRGKWHILEVANVYPS